MQNTTLKSIKISGLLVILLLSTFIAFPNLLMNLYSVPQIVIE